MEGYGGGVALKCMQLRERDSAPATAATSRAAISNSFHFFPSLFKEKEEEERKNPAGAAAPLLASVFSPRNHLWKKSSD